MGGDELHTLGPDSDDDGSADQDAGSHGQDEEDAEHSASEAHSGQEGDEEEEEGEEGDEEEEEGEETDVSGDEPQVKAGSQGRGRKAGRLNWESDSLGSDGGSDDEGDGDGGGGQGGEEGDSGGARRVADRRLLQTTEPFSEVQEVWMVDETDHVTGDVTAATYRLRNNPSHEMTSSGTSLPRAGSCTTFQNASYLASSTIMN